MIDNKSDLPIHRCAHSEHVVLNVVFNEPVVSSMKLADFSDRVW